jgi:hypothetical protein
VLGQCGEEDVPVLIPDGRRLGGQQADRDLDRLPPVFLQELRDQPSAGRFGRCGQQAAELGQRHRLVRLHASTLGHITPTASEPT